MAKITYPSKTTMNLAMRKKSPFRLTRLIPLLAVLVIGAGVFGKFAVADRLSTVSLAQGEVQALRSQIQALETETAGFSDLSHRYNRYSVGWMSKAEQAQVNPTQVLDVLEQEMMPKGGVVRFAISGNTLSVDLLGMTLSDTAGVVQSLYELEYVESVSVYTADNQEEASVSLVITVRKEGT